MRPTATGVLLVFLVAHQLPAQSVNSGTCGRYRQAPEPPYVLQLSTAGGGRLTYVGVAHTTDINSPSIAEIERQWRAIHPTIVFSEGGVWPLAGSREVAVSQYGEAGFVRFLAEKAPVPVRSLEPPAAEETAALLHSFTAEQLKLFYVLRQVYEYRRMHGEPAPDVYVQRALSTASRVRELTGKPATIAELEQSVAINFPELTDWRAVPESWFVPFGSAHWTNSVACESSHFRDRYMVSLLAGALQRHERVFAVVGVGHLATQEALLREKVSQMAK